MARHLDGHPRFDIALGAFQRLQDDELVIGIKAAHILRHFFIEKRAQSVDAFAVVARAFNGVEKGLLSRRWSVFGVVHGWLCVSNKLYNLQLSLYL